ncbi:MAG TPA: histidine phosphatase family protein [Usitatibacter sp.]|jgi:broad specificity phosphatase PhoE|nr:histidine phosphatase family protein [Usitatibacter sp.]
MALSRRAWLLAALGAAAAPCMALEDIWSRLRHGGLVILMRHGSTEGGYGDPPDFRLDDCRTQRNLGEAGRAEARRVGERLRAERVPIARVYTSPWCRCRETARIAFGEAEDWEALGLFIDAPDREADATARVLKRIASYARTKPHGNVAMVTHAVNIAALSQRTVKPAEIVVMRPDGCCGARTIEVIPP